MKINNIALMIGKKRLFKNYLYKKSKAIRFKIYLWAVTKKFKKSIKTNYKKARIIYNSFQKNYGANHQTNKKMRSPTI